MCLGRRRISEGVLEPVLTGGEKLRVDNSAASFLEGERSTPEGARL